MEQLSSSPSPPLLHAILEAPAPSLNYSSLLPTRSSGALPGAAAPLSPSAEPPGFTRWAFGAGSVCSQRPFNLACTLYISGNIYIRGNNAGSCHLSFPPVCAPTCWATGLGSSSTSLRLFGHRCQSTVVVFSTQRRQVFEDWGMSPSSGNVALNPTPAEEGGESSFPTCWVSALRT